MTPDAPIAPGRVLSGRYELVRPIARGGMAEVWEGRDGTLRRAVAIKILLTHLATDTTFVERFRREAVTSARVAHPCVVATYDAGVDAGTAYIVMELVAGQTLRQLLTASAPLDPGLAITIALQIADALANAHRAGLVHRDIKPGNVLLCDDGGGGLRVKVTDFGIAKVGAELGADLTQTGMVLGTPKYLSPEQVEGRVDPDARSDLYALGVVMFEMLTGRPPFNGPTDMATALSHLQEPAPRVSVLRPGVSAGLDDFVAGLLAKSPGDRPPTAVAARQALDVLARRGPGGRSAPDTGRAPRPDRTTATTTAATAAATPADLRPPALSGPVGNDAWRRSGNDAWRRSGTDPRGTPPVPPRAGARNGPPAPAGPARPAPASTPRPAFTSQPASTPRPAGAPRPAGGRPAPARSRPSRTRRSSRIPGLVVAVIVLVAVIVAAILIADHGGAGRAAGGGAAAGSAAAYPVAGADVWLDVTGHTLDNAAETKYLYDGATSTSWQSDSYGSPTFGGLYDGLGLAVHLTGSHTLDRLVVSSPSDGWAASTYVSSSEPAIGSPVSAWGAATDSSKGIEGDATLSLGGRTGQWVLLWITDLGPAQRITISEVAVH